VRVSPSAARTSAIVADGAEDLCCLTGDWRILQRRDGHRWSLDDLVTAWLAMRAPAATPPAHVLDLGCGIGAVLLMLAWRFREARAIGLEAQADSVAMAARSIDWNGVGERCVARLGDLRDADALGVAARFDLVTATPPYLVPGRAVIPRRRQQAGCHVELRGGIEDYCDAAARWLAPIGRFVVCHSDVERTRHALERSGLALEERLDVIPREGKPRLFSVFAASQAGRLPLRVTTLVVRGFDGQWTDAFRMLRLEMGMPIGRARAASISGPPRPAARA
jgi:tRNA1(Val) A37 N6-methylase TrmN6